MHESWSSRDRSRSLDHARTQRLRIHAALARAFARQCMLTVAIRRARPSRRRARFQKESRAKSEEILGFQHSLNWHKHVPTRSGVQERKQTTKLGARTKIEALPTRAGHQQVLEKPILSVPSRLQRTFTIFGRGPCRRDPGDPGCGCDCGCGCGLSCGPSLSLSPCPCRRGRGHGAETGSGCDDAANGCVCCKHAE